MERFREETNTERLKSDRLQEEVSRLKSRLRESIRPGSKSLGWLLPHCKYRYKNVDFVWDFLILKKDCQEAYVSFFCSKSCLDFNK